MAPTQSQLGDPATDAVTQQAPSASELPGTAEAEAVPAEVPAGRRFLWFQALPAWFISMLLHVLMLLMLALITFTPVENVTAILTVSSVDPTDAEMEEFQLDPIDPGALDDAEQPPEEPQVSTPQPMAVSEPVPVESPLALESLAEVPDLIDQIAPNDNLLQTLDMAAQEAMSSRSAGMKKQLLRRYGGTESSEAAVARALKWIALHQLPNGAWTFAHNHVCRGRCGDPGERIKAVNAATAIALLPYLGAGQTHLQGEYKEVVHKGLLFLVSNMKVEGRGLIRGDLSEAEGNMYSHGLAAIALCEAYAMTEDPDLARPAQAALNHIIHAQHGAGGWRYNVGQAGDTSVTGWQLMALKSGHMGHLVVPPQTIRGASMFLDQVQTNGGAYYGYDKAVTKPRATTTAIGLLCRMYLGWGKNQPGMVEGIKYLAKQGVDKQDIYYDYYAAQVLRHFGGPEWEKFNNEMRDWLVETQETQGHPTGSWHFPDSKSHRGPKEGGRLLSTAFATMMLEVYYRHMPLYADAAAEDEFPL